MRCRSRRPSRRRRSSPTRRARSCARRPPPRSSPPSKTSSRTTSRPAPRLEPSPEPGAVEPTPSGSADPSDDPLGDAVETARQTRERLGCDDPAFQASLEEGLDAIEPESAIPAAIWRRLSASLLGEVRQEAGEWALEPGADLHDAVARAAEGTTIVLPAGTLELDETLVLLQGVTLKGAGRDATTIRSTAPDAAVIVATAGLVRLEDLTLELAGQQAASGLVAGPSASVSLVTVRVAGAVAAADGVGGAGVYLSAEGDEGSGRGTTLEVTDALFERNQWAGITVAGGHRVSIRSAVFAGNGEVGILFLDSASGSVSASTFTDNRVALAASGSATPTWLSNTISGGSVGMQLDADAVPVIDLRQGQRHQLGGGDLRRPLSRIDHRHGVRERPVRDRHLRHRHPDGGSEQLRARPRRILSPRAVPRLAARHESSPTMNESLYTAAERCHTRDLSDAR